MLTGHASFRSWCAACVQGRGRAEGHQGESRKELEDGSKVRRIVGLLPPKVTNDWSEHAIVLLRLPTNQRMKRPIERDIALRANGRNLLRRPEKEAAVAVAAVRRRHLRHRLRHRHLNHHHLQNGVWNRKTEMTDETVDQQGESKRRRGLKLRTAVAMVAAAAAAVKAQPTLK